MSTNYPSSLDSYTTLVDNTDDVLAAHANDRGDAIEALEAKLGIDSSSVTTTIDYFLKHTSGAYRTHTHDGTSDDGANVPLANTTGTLPVNRGGTGSATQNFVDLTTAQSVAGIKTFSSIPVGPASNPTTDNQLARKKYVDDEIDAIVIPTQSQLFHVRDEKAANTVAATITSGDWRTRELNTVLTNEISGASLASNQITLPAGTYWIQADCAGDGAESRSKAIFYNVTDAANAIIGKTAHGGTGESKWCPSTINGLITITDTKVFELRHRVNASRPGGPTPSNWGVVEVYAEVMIWKRT